MGGLDKVLMDNNGSGGSVPYLSLNELIKRLPQSATKPGSEGSAAPSQSVTQQPVAGANP